MLSANSSNEIPSDQGVGRSDGESTVSEESDNTELSEDEIAAQTQRNSSLIQQHMAKSFFEEREIQFAYGPLEGEPITTVAPPVAMLLHMPEEGDVSGPENLQFQPCSPRDVGMFFDIWLILSARCAELGQSMFEPGDLIEATCARHATLLFSETCMSLLFIAAIESERSGRGKFLDDVRHLSILTWQEHARRLFESKGAMPLDFSRRRSGAADSEGDSALEEMCSQMITRDFHLMDIDCKVMMLRCLLLACTQPAMSLQKAELKTSLSDPRPKRQAAKNYLAALDATTVVDRDTKRYKSGNHISEAIDGSSLSTCHLLGRVAPLGTDRHGNRFYHVASDPGRVFCESFNKLWWMVYETPGQISSLLNYLHPCGEEEHSLLRALVGISREISRGISARRSQEPHVDVIVDIDSKKSSSNSKAKIAAAKSSSVLSIPDWLADAEGGFLARQLVFVSEAGLSPASISSCVPPGVGYADLKFNRTSESVGLGATSLFGTPDGHADEIDGDEQLISRHWLPVFLRRRRFSNRVRLFENSLHFSGFRSLCLQAFPVNRLISSLIGSSPTKHCTHLIADTFKLRGENRADDAASLNASAAPDALPADISGVQRQLEASVDMPGIYEPIAFLKAHAIQLCEKILSVVKTSFESMERLIISLFVMMSSNELFSCRIFRQMANLYFRIAILRRD
jgi:hypothetical protein